MTLQGKGIFIWQIPNCENGDPKAIADVAQSARFSHVLIKVADSIYPYNIYAGVDRVPAVASALRTRGIQVWGWHYVRGDNPLGEAEIALERIRTLNLDGYVIDVEGEYKEYGKRAAASTFIDRFRASQPGITLALSSYRYPSYHPQIPWREFLKGCDLSMPQVYWVFANNSGDQLTRSMREYQAMTPFRPFVPTGAAYKERGWAPTPAEIQDFLLTSQRLNLSAANFYSWDSSRAYLPDVWEAIRSYSWSPGSEQPDISQQYIAALNKRDLNAITGLYTSSGVHITAARSIRGTQAIRAWYQVLLSQLLPNAVFTLTSYSGVGNSRHFTWTATSSQGKVNNGNDTFGLSEGKIIYHYTFFTVTS